MSLFDARDRDRIFLLTLATEQAMDACRSGCYSGYCLAGVLLELIVPPKSAPPTEVSLPIISCILLVIVDVLLDFLILLDHHFLKRRQG